MKHGLMLIAMLMLVFTVTGETIEIVPASPVEGEDFVVRVSGVWRDSCVPMEATVFVTGNWIIPTFTLQSGVCLAAPTPYAAEAVIPRRAAHPGYRIYPRVIDFDGTVTSLGETTVEVPAAQSEALLYASPDFGPASRPTLVHINGTFTCEVDCTPVRAWLGDQELEQVQVLSDSVISGYTSLGATPDQVVDLVVQRGGREWRRVGGFRYLAPGEFQAVMAPLWFLDPVEGAHGSLWTSSFLLHNGHEVTLLPGADLLSIDTTCPILCPLPVVPPNTEVQPILDVRHDSPTPAAMVYVHKTLVSQISFGARTRDMSRQSETWGTEVPVVRDSELTPYATLRLLDVPTEDGFRVMLRLYALAGSGGVVVRVLEAGSGETLIEELVPLFTAAGSLVPWSFFPSQPAYAQVPNLQDRPELIGVDRVRVELYGTSPLIWGMASVTHEESQHVTLITPQ